MENRTLRDVGGTPGGIGEFIGVVIASVGGYPLSNQISIVGCCWSSDSAVIPVLYSTRR
jgi:hypothetical protein